jgi:hypothetical protein
VLAVIHLLHPIPPQAIALWVLLPDQSQPSLLRHPQAPSYKLRATGVYAPGEGSSVPQSEKWTH